jgi:phosphoribosylanthranilate isomerase
VQAGVGALGFNFWPRSPRYIRPERAAAIPADVLRVGVFVGEPAASIREIASIAALDVVQLHGAASPPPGLRAWRAASVAPGFDPALLEPGYEAYLLDAPAGELHGGSGKAFDWALVRDTALRIILAGGLDAFNVGRAIETAHPWGVDACSRLESRPGIKDHHKVAAFCKAALQAAS